MFVNIGHSCPYDRCFAFCMCEGVSPAEILRCVCCCTCVCFDNSSLGRTHDLLYSTPRSHSTDTCIMDKVHMQCLR